jgi:hypothetical protein
MMFLTELIIPVKLQVRIDYQHQNVTDGAFYVSNGFVFTDLNRKAHVNGSMLGQAV